VQYLTNIGINYNKPIGLTDEGKTLKTNFSNAMSSFVKNSLFVYNLLDNQAFEEFTQLKDKWEKETSFFSSSTDIISNPSYIEIINIGERAVTWILNELDQNSGHWFFALEKITGANPIKQKNIGFIDEMKKDWLDWASKNNYKWN